MYPVLATTTLSRLLANSNRLVDRSPDVRVLVFMRMPELVGEVCHSHKHSTDPVNREDFFDLIQSGARLDQWDEEACLGDLALHVLNALRTGHRPSLVPIGNEVGDRSGLIS